MRLTCERCGAAQPSDWSAGDLCPNCGAAARREQRCAWCAKWTPAGRFCRHCGCELLEDARWGAARMLKAGGVDKFQLAHRLAGLDADHAEHLQRLFEAQRAVVARRVDEVRLCERALVAGGHADRLEDALVPRLPLEEAALAELGSGPQGPFDSLEQLDRIASESPLAGTRRLANLALLRLKESARARLRDALAALADPELSLEAALALSHWRIWTSDLREVVEIAAAAAPGLATPRTRAWAAVANSRLAQWLSSLDEYGQRLVRRRDGATLARCQLEGLAPALEDGLVSGEPDLKLCCALLLGRSEAAEEAARAADPALAELGRRWLATRKSPAAMRILAEGDDGARLEVLRSLREDGLGEAWRESLLLAVERGGEEIRGRAAWKLKALWTDLSVERALAVAVREKDDEVLKALLFVDQLPSLEVVVRRAFEAGMDARHADRLSAHAREGRVSAALARELVEGARDEERLRGALRLAESALAHAPEPALVDAVARLILSDRPRKARVEATWVLTRLHRHHGLAEDVVRFAPDDARRLFGSEAELVERLLRTFQDDELLHEVGFYDWLAAQLKYHSDPALCAGDAALQARLLDGLVDLSMKDVWLYLRTGAAELAGRIGATPALRGHLTARMKTLADRDVPYDLKYWFERYSKQEDG